MDEIRRRLHFALDAAKMSVWDSTLADGNVLSRVIDWPPDGIASQGLPPKPRQMPFLDYLAFKWGSAR